jgi:DNA-binding transcriptional ArsR family regulator
MVSMDDERAGKIAEVLGNKTCKKIIDLLSEKEASEKEIADKLKIPMNTAEYNLKKLLHSGLIEKTKKFFWSAKGKKIVMYKLSNKSIVISPKGKINSEIKTILPVAIVSGVLALIVRQLTKTNITREVMDKGLSAPAVAELASGAQTGVFTLAQIPIWIWFWLGTVIALVIFAVINWRSNK